MWTLQEMRKVWEVHVYSAMGLIWFAHEVSKSHMHVWADIYRQTSTGQRLNIDQQCMISH